MIKKLLHYAKKYRLVSLLSPVSIAFEVVIEVFIPYLMSIIIDCGIRGADISTKKGFVVNVLLALGFGKKTGIDLVVEMGVLMVVMALFALIFGAAAARFAAKAGMGFGAELRHAIFCKVQDFSFGNVDKFSTGSLITRMTTDINTVQMGYMMALRMLFRSPLMLIMAIFMAFQINSRLAGVFLGVAPLMAFALLFIGLKSYPRFRRMFKKYDRFNTGIQENLIAARVVKAFVRAKHEKEKFRASNDDLKAASIFAEKLIILNGPVMTLSISACMVLILWFGGNLVLKGEMQIGDVTSFVTYVQQILMSLMMISMIFVVSVMGRASIARIVEVLDEVPDISDADADPEAVVENGSVEFKNVCFKYKKDGQNNVLDNINLSIASGETVGILGGTGSAKTSLVQLIPRLYDITDGELLVGGRPVKDYTLRNLRNGISMVLQNNVLFSGTIESNLRWGNENATEEEIKAAAEIAQAAPFIETFADKYDSEIEQGGVNVSGGQKQRLCIARAILKKPKILILDDSTSAVDTATDAKIRAGFRDSLGDTTTIIIAQRINSIMHADKIIVLDDGKINGIGTHEQLLQNNEIYRDVFTSQQEGKGEEVSA